MSNKKRPILGPFLLLVSKSTAKGGFMSGHFKGPAQNKTIGGDYSNGCGINPLWRASSLRCTLLLEKYRRYERPLMLGRALDDQ